MAQRPHSTRSHQGCYDRPNFAIFGYNRCILSTKHLKAIIMTTEAQGPKTVPNTPSTATRSVAAPPPFRALMYALCVAVALVCGVLLVLAIGPRFAQLTTAVPSGAAVYQLDPSEAELMASYGVSLTTYAIYNLIFEFVQVLAFVGVAVVLLWRRQGGASVMGLFTALWLIVFGTLSPATVFALRTADGISGGEAVRVAFDSLQMLRYLLPILFIYLFPDGHFVPRWSRWVALVWALLTVSILTFFGAPDGWSAAAQGIAAVLWIAPGIAAQFYRYYRVSDALQKQQTRWFVFGLIVVLLGGVVRAALLTLFPPLSQAGAGRLLFYTLVAVPLLDTVTFVALPITMGVALTRYQLYGLSMVVNRSLVYGIAVTGLLLVFFLGFFLIQGLLQLFNGSPTLALVIATGITVALFDPTRRFLQKRIDRLWFKNVTNKAPPPNPRIGALSGLKVGTYTVGQIVGRGGMGIVYRGEHATLGRPVAIKVLPETTNDRPTHRARFDREAKTVASLKHPNIVEVFDYGLVDHLIETPARYLVMEYLEGYTLRDYLKHYGTVSLADTQQLLRGIADALDYAHTRLIVHRDVKPSNIMLRLNSQASRRRTQAMRVVVDDEADSIKPNTSDSVTLAGDPTAPPPAPSPNLPDERTEPLLFNTQQDSANALPSQLSISWSLADVQLADVQAVLMDFGVAKIEDGNQLTQTGLVGTLDYAAPEQLLRSSDVDGRADVYSLGVLAYQMVTGVLPFKGAIGDMVYAHARQAPPDPRTYRPDLPPHAAAVILRALAKDPQARFPTATAFVAALDPSA
jgi:serine/threonine protein kinase